MVPRTLEDLRQRSDPEIEISLIPGPVLIVDRRVHMFRHLAQPGDVVVRPGEQHRPRRRARGRRVEVGQPDPRAGQAVGRRRRDLGSKGTRVAVAQVVGHDDEEVGALGGGAHLLSYLDRCGLEEK